MNSRQQVTMGNRNIHVIPMKPQQRQYIPQQQQQYQQQQVVYQSQQFTPRNSFRSRGISSQVHRGPISQRLGPALSPQGKSMGRMNGTSVGFNNNTTHNNNLRKPVTNGTSMTSHRGRRGGFGGGRGGRGGRRQRLKSASDLDKELDQYMLKDKEFATKKLDADLDAYMNDAAAMDGTAEGTEDATADDITITA